eukprot:TRINITY_DN3882_c0_g1_i1.p1 TRINITY_DN3882_c0_g1~~TRINITY_DN3882_c0_g1_i1.p1  ORF type:complete len:168 (-),score=37.51 TRINITY_DN3882_c0_g1_i1:193-696(-)
MLPFSIKIWLAVTSVVVLWDAGYILNRPESMAGGSLEWVWFPYVDYIKNVDPRYGDLTDGFVIAQARMNIVEVFFQLSALYLASRKSTAAYVATLVGAVMTCSKTVLYFLVEWDGGMKYTKTSKPFDFWFYGIFLNGLWIVVPGLIALWAASTINRLLAKKSPAKQN